MVKAYQLELTCFMERLKATFVLRLARKSLQFGNIIQVVFSYGSNYQRTCKEKSTNSSWISGYALFHGDSINANQLNLGCNCLREQITFNISQFGHIQPKKTVQLELGEVFAKQPFLLLKLSCRQLFQ